MSAVIELQSIGKRYRIGSQDQPLTSNLRDAIRDTLRHLRHPRSFLLNRPEEFWALKDVSFSVNEGEVIGIVGRNGAGKSTLLKILSRITAPTKGRVLVRGRLASLLEVGTGFHPELTGRENIFMNGAILGMTRAEIRAKFEEIVEFSEVGKFIDTPVKRYSSGMYIRLAFAVAAHLDPDILIVDEVLSVGDVAFQKKCIGAMQNAAKGNRTVLFVTHNLSLVRSLCSRAILLDKRTAAMDGPVEEVLNAFTKSLILPRDLSQENLGNRRARHSSSLVRFDRVVARDGEGRENWSFQAGETIRLELGFKTFEKVTGLGICVMVKAPISGDVITTITETVTEEEIKAGTHGSIELVIPENRFRPGDYSFAISLHDAGFEKQHDVVDENVNLPLLSIASDEKILQKRSGYLSMPARIALSQS